MWISARLTKYEMRIREIIDLLESIENRDRTFYHVTLAKNLAEIMQRGLVPSVGKRSKKLREPSAVFLFPTRDSAEDAVSGWLGDEIEEDDSLALLEVILPPEIEVFKNEQIDWELYTKVVIPPECLSIITRDL